MRLAGLATLTAVAVLPGIAQPGRNESERKVVMCLCGRHPDAEMDRARDIAARMFAGIRITTEWHYGNTLCRDETRRHFVIALQDDAPAGISPRALAYALPYEGVHVQVYYAKVQGAVDRLEVPSLLAYVLVHELTHLMQESDHHSSSGVMKAHWNRGDHEAMRSRSLGFSPEDVLLIRDGLDSWASRRRAVLETAAVRAPK